MTNSNLKGNYKTKSEVLNDVKPLIEYYYSTNSKRNAWRVREAIELAKKQLDTIGEVILKGAQWGGKWGNYYRLIALNSKGEYQYVEGFNPYKLLS